MINLFKKTCFALLILSYGNSYAADAVVDMTNPHMSFDNPVFDLYLYYGKFQVGKTITYQCTITVTPVSGREPVTFVFNTPPNNYVKILSWNGNKQFDSTTTVTSQFTAEVLIQTATAGNQIAESPIYLGAVVSNPDVEDIAFSGKIDCQ